MDPALRPYSKAYSRATTCQRQSHNMKRDTIKEQAPQTKETVSPVKASSLFSVGKGFRPGLN
jgi:hypothetical protein